MLIQPHAIKASYCNLNHRLTQERISVICEIMNITLSSDKSTLEKTRQYARRQGMSLNELLRRYMESVSQVDNVDSVMEEFSQNALSQGGQSAPGYRFDREDAHRR
jgi:hypothetical protein